MSSSRRGSLDKSDKKKAKTEEVEDGPSSFGTPRPPGYLCDGMENSEDFDVSAWNEKGGGEEEEELDPLVVFGSGIMLMILSILDARSVALARLVSRDWHRVASSDEIWLPKEEKASCRFTGRMEAFWYRKWHVSLSLLSLEAFSISSLKVGCLRFPIQFLLALWLLQSEITLVIISGDEG